MFLRFCKILCAGNSKRFSLLDVSGSVLQKVIPKMFVTSHDLCLGKAQTSVQSVSVSNSDRRVCTSDVTQSYYTVYHVVLQ